MTESHQLFFPELPEPYDSALRECMSRAMKQHQLVAALVSGTVLRGTPDEHSDLDIHLLSQEGYRQRLQEIHCGVACEIFLNPPSRIQQYFEEEKEGRRPMTAHMFATGYVIYDQDGIAHELKRQAKHILAKEPKAATPQDLVQARYGAATMYEDAVDLFHRENDSCAIVLAKAVAELIECRLSAESGWLPRPKDLLKRLRDIDPESARLATVALSSVPLLARMHAGEALSLRVTGAKGFFEWASTPEAC